MVESVRSVTLPDDNWGDSVFAGAAVGGLLGEGFGFSGALLGTVGGGLAGNEVHRRTIVREGQEIVVRLDDGNTVKVMQPARRFELGHRVRVLSGPKGSRVEPG